MAIVSSVGDSGNPLIDSLVWGSRWGAGDSKTIVKIGFSTNGGVQPNWQEIRAIEQLMISYEAVINVDFQFVGNVASKAADIVFKFQDNTSSPYYGTGDAPGEAGATSTITIQRGNYKGGSDSAMRAGSFDFFTLQHEFGHAMGLAHPHDEGGTTNDSSLLFPGLGGSYSDLGQYGLNQTVFTVMSYNTAWKTAPSNHTPVLASNAAGPMAIDIAALQHIYGANYNAANGNTVYLLSTQVTQRAFTAIWDTGGNDTISAKNMGASVIDLRSATLTVSAGGGGYVSYSLDQPGGFTIAKNAIVENAVGGAANDVLKGNSSRNTLTGGNGRDELYGRSGNDRFDFNHWTDSNGSAIDVIKDFTKGDHIDLSSMDANWNRSFFQHFVFKGDVNQFSGAGQIKFAYSGDDTLVYLNFDSDQTAESTIRLSGHHQLDKYDFIL